MSIIKLERNGKIIERSRADYEANKVRYDLRGFKEAKPNSAPKKEQPKDQTIVASDLSSEWQEEKPSKSKKKDK
tara:strand:- start:122 stop:343 length:222 start_codon:yes stop_codon:yes gene_type:complete